MEILLMKRMGTQEALTAISFGQGNDHDSLPTRETTSLLNVHKKRFHVFIPQNHTYCSDELNTINRNNLLQTVFYSS